MCIILWFIPSESIFNCIYSIMDVFLFIVLLAVSFCLGLLAALVGLAYYILYFRNMDENAKPDIKQSPNKLRQSGQFVHFASPLDSTRRSINIIPMDNSISKSSYSATPLGRRLGQQSLELRLQNALALQQQREAAYPEYMLNSGVTDLSSVVLGTDSGIYLPQCVAGDPGMATRKTSTVRDEITHHGLGINNELCLPQHVSGKGSGNKPCMAVRKSSTTRQEFSGICSAPSFAKCSIIEIDD